MGVGGLIWEGRRVKQEKRGGGGGEESILKAGSVFVFEESVGEKRGGSKDLVRRRHLFFDIAIFRSIRLN